MEEKNEKELFFEELHDYAMETFDLLINNNGGYEYEGEDEDVEEKLDFLIMLEEFYFFYVRRNKNFDLFMRVLFDTINIMKKMNFDEKDLEIISKFNEDYFAKYTKLCNENV